MGLIDDRRIYTLDRTEKLKELLRLSGELAEAKASVVASGSYGRLEAGVHSDLDVCIVALCADDGKSKLSLLDEISLKADLISAVKILGLPEIDGDGKYLGQFSSSSLVSEIGSPQDDALNTFSTRMLMLLEGRSIIHGGIFDEIKESIISAYWLDYDAHKAEFIPAYFTNDILRLWRTFCINYEARTRDLPEEKKLRRKVKNYKLKHSRILTCYSAIIYLLAVYNIKNTVSKSDALGMCSKTPLERLNWIGEQEALGAARSVVKKLTTMYEDFLRATDHNNEVLEKKILDNENYTREDYMFGQEMFNAVNVIGDGSKFHRLIVV